MQDIDFFGRATTMESRFERGITVRISMNEFPNSFAQVIDLSHPITQQMPVYPGTQSPKITPVNTLDHDGFLEHSITMVTHTGTHLDVPAHMIPAGRTLDSFGAEVFVDSAVVLDVRTAGPVVERSFIEAHQRTLKGCRWVLLGTSWSDRWGSPEYFEGYPALSPEAATWLVEQGIVGVGIDAISIDRADSQDFPVHQILLGNDVLVIENLTNLLPLVGQRFVFSAPPLALAGVDGSPVRAVALLNQS